MSFRVDRLKIGGMHDEKIPIQTDGGEWHHRPDERQHVEKAERHAGIASQPPLAVHNGVERGG